MVKKTPPFIPVHAFEACQPAHELWLSKTSSLSDISHDVMASVQTGKVKHSFKHV